MEMLINASDLIVVGEIAKTHIGAYTFSIDQIVKGESNVSIKVQLFREWTCDHRSREVVVGQQIVLFLNRVDGKLEIINGSTGEIFIDDDIVQYKLLDTKPSLDEFTGMISDFLSCYAAKNKPTVLWEKMFYTQLKSDDEITEIRIQSVYSNWLFGRLEEDQISK